MSPCLFAIFIDDFVTKLKSLGLGCNTILTCTSIFLYAEDIMLISPSVSMLQTMLHVCESELVDLNMSLNVKKSVCMRFGPRFNATCANLTTLGGDLLAWVGICRYLGVTFRVLERLNPVLTTVKLVFTAHLTPFTVVLVVVLRLK